ncbi:MAG: DUF3192 domain-containing protein [Candidatus Omnitrophica bacterium]|nr:DUF3192 domain-containing protein [Candidatus Omnitrophota bacterium]
MRKLIFLFVMALLVSGCTTTDTLDNFRKGNRHKLYQLKIGMTKDEAVNLMGTNAAFDSEFGIDPITVNNPYRYEILQGKDKVLEILYYYTALKAREGTFTDDELTPLVFDNGKLIGWGNRFLRNNIQK